MINHVGTKDIETKRLFLRKFKMEDAKQMFNNWASNPENTTYMSWQAHKSVDETKGIISKWIFEYEKDSTYNWCITLKDIKQPIGSIGVGKILDDIDCCEVGYVLSKNYWNKGIMTEALKGVLKYLFQKANFNRIQAIHNVKNPASGKVMAKSGMTYEGTLKQFAKNNVGELVDVSLYSILKSEFE